MKKYYFKEKFFKLTDKYPILDENGNEVYFLTKILNLLAIRLS